MVDSPVCPVGSGAETRPKTILSVIKRLSLPISRVFKAIENREPDRVGCYRLCAASMWATKYCRKSRGTCPIAGDANDLWWNKVYILCTYDGLKCTKIVCRLGSPGLAWGANGAPAGPLLGFRGHFVIGREGRWTTEWSEGRETEGRKWGKRGKGWERRGTCFISFRG